MIRKFKSGDLVRKLFYNEDNKLYIYLGEEPSRIEDGIYAPAAYWLLNDEGKKVLVCQYLQLVRSVDDCLG